MDIILGREEGVRRLHCIANGRDFYIGQAGSVPLSVSRKHCKLTIQGTSIYIENIKPQNITFVDGNQIFRKHITPASNVQLGETRFTVPLQQILTLATGKYANDFLQSEVPTYSLKPLEKIWEEYDIQKLNIQENAAKRANRQRLQSILSMLSLCLGLIPGIPNILRGIIIITALILAIYFFIQGQSKATVQRQIHDLDENFAHKYKCPNPKCERSFGPIPYHQIKYNKTCPACGCKYTH